jgi:S-DNA-T family DNA segregation ATPase FtsK/SpoIIIE
LTEATVGKKAKPPLKLSAAVARSLREGTLWVLGALSLILLLALLSFHRRIPGFWNTGEPGPVGNWIGPVGAWLSGFFLFLFGRPAYLFPVMLAYAGWLVHKEQALPDARSRATRCCGRPGSLLTLMTSCGLATLHWDPTGLPNSAGGVLGRTRRHGGAQGLSFLGATLLLLGLWLAGVALFLGVSWFDIMDSSGAWVLRGIEWTRHQARAAPRAGLRQGAQAGAPGSRARGTEKGREPAAAAHRARGAGAAKRASASSASARCRCSMRRSRASCRRSRAR